MAVSGFSPVMPHPEQDASVFSRSHFLDYTFSITLGSSIAAMIYRAAFRIAATFIALLNLY